MIDKTISKMKFDELLSEYDALKTMYSELKKHNDELKKQISFYSEGMRIQEEEIEQLRKELLERSKND